MGRNIFVTMLMCCIGWTCSADILTLKIPLARSQHDISYDYHTKLLAAAIERGSEGKHTASFIAEVDMHEGRATRELIKGENLDVFWMGTDYSKEQQLRAVPIPTTRGLIGFRKFVIRKQDIGKFARINTIERLRELTACQGTGWPDTLILRNAQIKVATTPALENIYKMLAAGRCDFFPRGYHDHQKELQLRAEQYPTLLSYQGIMLHYPFAVYFFTSLENAELASWIEKGLDMMIDSGEFQLHMQTHELTRDVFPLGKEADVRAISVKNVILSEGTDYSNERYWFQPKDFGLK
ncbi:MAG: hypothetical protein Alis3KO_28080 [Aliiglaciecola sp.]